MKLFFEMTCLYLEEYPIRCAPPPTSPLESSDSGAESAQLGIGEEPFQQISADIFISNPKLFRGRRHYLFTHRWRSITAVNQQVANQCVCVCERSPLSLGAAAQLPVSDWPLISRLSEIRDITTFPFIKQKM